MFLFWWMMDSFVSSMAFIYTSLGVIVDVAGHLAETSRSGLSVLPNSPNLDIRLELESQWINNLKLERCNQYGIYKIILVFVSIITIHKCCSDCITSTTSYCTMYESLFWLVIRCTAFLIFMFGLHSISFQAGLMLERLLVILMF